MTPEQAETGDPRLPFGARIYAGIAARLPKRRRNQVIVAAIAAVILLIPSTALLILPFYVDLGESRYSGLGYAGVFLANLASTVTVIIPVPALTAAGQALIVTTSSQLNWIVVGILGGLGMALGEITAYAAGAIGHEVARGSHIEAKGRVSRILLQAGNWISHLMHTHGMATLYLLSAIPNPLFEVAGLTAGAVRMNFWKFMLAVTTGKITRGLLLAFIGFAGLSIFGIS